MRFMRNSLFRLGGLAAAAALAAMAFASAANAETTLEKIKREGTIKIGIFNEVPAGYVTEDGKITGESPEILRAVLKQMGDIKMDADVIDEFGALIPGLLAGRFDVIAAGMYIKPSRCEQISFTRPTVKYGETLIVKKGNPENIHSYEDIRDNDDLKIAAAAGGTEVKFAKQVGIPDDRIMIVSNYPTAVTALRTGRVHAIAPPAVTGQSIVNEAEPKDIELADPFNDPIIDGKPAVSYAGLGVRKEDKDLLAALNAGLDKIVNTEEHIAIVEPFGFGKAQMPGDKTTEEICKGM